MNKKTKLLFVIESLTLAGSEKSLIALLSNIDPDLYDIDLQLFQYGNELEKFIPAYVNVLPPLQYTRYVSQSWKQNFKKLLTAKKTSFFKTRLNYSINLRMKKRNHPEIAQLYWETVRDQFMTQGKIYDVGIAFAQGVPTYYVSDKIKSAKKVTWVNTNVKFPDKNKKFQEDYYRQFDEIVAVSEDTKKHLIELYPHLSDKYRVILDIIDYKSICKMADLYETRMRKNKYNILTVSRLNSNMKGMDITLKVCKILSDKNLDFRWYILGKGSYEEAMIRFIEKHNLENNLSLMGVTDNPYPYFKTADLYVQTSRHEGFGLSIAEARLLNTPVVTTRFDTVFMQMIDGKNGLVTDINAKAVADAVERMMTDDNLYNSIKSYLAREEKENLKSVEKFDRLIRDLVP